MPRLDPSLVRKYLVRFRQLFQRRYYLGLQDLEESDRDLPEIVLAVPRFRREYSRQRDN